MSAISRTPLGGFLRGVWRAACCFGSRVCHAFELWAGYDFTWRDAWDTARDWC